jgi:superfamily II DNA or RNA helicase
MVHQTADMLADYLKVKAGKIGAGKKDIRTITVSTSQSLKTKSVQSLIETRKWKPDLILVDEVDHAGAWGVYQALRRFSAYYVYGFSATPFRRKGDKLLLEAGYGHVNAEVSLSDLQDQGYLAPITVRVREIGEENKLPAGSAQSWQEVYKRGVVTHAERNRAVIEDIKALVDEGRQVLVNVDELTHIPALVGPDGVPDAIVVTGSEDPADRKVIYKAFREGKVPVLLGTVLRRGLDLPSADAVVLAGGKKSQTQTMQQMGRGLRPSPGKDDCIVQDYLDHQHGLLFEHSQQRFKTMEEAGFNVPEGMIREIEAPQIDMDAAAIDKIRERQAALLEQRLDRENRI